jgi:hypothetical protein
MIRDVLQGTAWGILFGAAWFAASLAAALVIGRWMRGPRTPVPGIPPEERTTQVLPSAPAPGPPRPGHGGALVSIHFYPGGVTRLDDHQRERSFLIEPPADEEADAVFLARIEAELRQQP